MEFGAQYTPYDVGLGGFIEGQTRKQIQTPSERFYTKLYESFELLNSIDPSLVSQEKKNKIEKFSSMMKNMVYKNATTFILGCLCIKNGIINTDKLNRIIPLLIHFKNTENISTSDVIRYARFAQFKKF